MPDGVTIFHNPACSTSRKTLELLRERGLDPTVVDYLKTSWTRPQLNDLLRRMAATPRDLLRPREAKAEELGLTDPGASDEAILAAMVAHPVLVNRPIVVTGKGARLARPIESVLEIL